MVIPGILEFQTCVCIIIIQEMQEGAAQVIAMKLTRTKLSLDRSQPTYLSLYLRQEFLLRKLADLRCCSVQDRLWICCHGSTL